VKREMNADLPKKSIEITKMILVELGLEEK